MSQSSSKLPSKSKLGYLSKPQVSSASSAAKALIRPGLSTPKRRKRQFSEANLSPSEPERSPKMSKIEVQEIKEELKQHAEDTRKDMKVQSDTFQQHMKEQHESLMKAMQTNSENLAQTLGLKIATENQALLSNMSHQISEIKTRQDHETLSRKELETKVTVLQAQYGDVSDKLDRVLAQPAADPAVVAQQLLPQVTADLSGQIKSHNNQVKSTYFQSLVNEIKQHETSMMIYGYKPDGGPDLATEIKDKIFQTQMGLEIDNIKAIKVGVAEVGKPQPIRVTFTSAEIRNTVLGKGSKLPKGGTRIEKCLPRRYRQKNKEFVDYGWQLKMIRNVKTRTVFKAHNLVLEMKDLDEGEQKSDWMIMKEFYPEPETPTDKGETNRTRVGFKATKPLEEKNIVIFSNLTINNDKETTKTYFKDKYLTNGDDTKVLQVNTDKIEKKLLIVTLTDRKTCFDFATKYKTVKFNDSEPRISVLLGGKD